MSRVNFGQIANDETCGCGQHTGVGEWSPADRAANYARIRDRLAPYYEPDRQRYLESWEEAHGKVSYRMVNSHISTVTEQKMFGTTTGTQVMKPVMDDGLPGYIAKQQAPTRSWHEAF